MNVKNIGNTIYNNLQSLNNSRFFAGLVMLMLNIGSKYVNINLSKVQEQYLKKTFARQLLIFSICWMGTRDIVTSIILTASFIFLSDYLLNENSKICVLPESWRTLEKIIDVNNDGKLSEEEIQNAIKILKDAKGIDNKHIQTRMNNSFK